MANNIEDNDNSYMRAPENFHITNENEHGIHWSDYRVKCPLCNYSRKIFFCQYCIRDGNFVHTSHHMVERFSEKQLKYKNQKSVHQSQELKCQQLLLKRKLIEDLQCAVKQKRENISVLKKLIEERTINIRDLKEKCQRLTSINRYSSKQMPQYIAKCRQFSDYIEKTDERNAKLNEDGKRLQEQLKKLRIQNIMKLVKFIFPLSERISKADPIALQSTDSNEISRKSGDLNAIPITTETMNALAEATHTAYIRGRWVLQDSHNELQHVIVDPSLPANGDYSAYNDWVATIKDGVPNPPGTTETLTSINCAYRISAALTYTTQLVHLLSFYLDVRLPYKLNYSDFCKKELNEASFGRKVTRLNTNILYLCYTQRVKLTTLSPCQTLDNINRLLNLEYSDLGRVGSVDINDCFPDLMDIQMMQNLTSGSDSGSDEDENILPTEWEAVSHPHQGPEIIFPPHVQNSQQTASMAGGLMTSAVQSMASIWRVFTTGK